MILFVIGVVSVSVAVVGVVHDASLVPFLGCIGHDYTGGLAFCQGEEQKIYVIFMTCARPCLKIGNVPDGEEFFRQTRRFDAAILCVLQGKSTQYGGKRTAVWAY